MMAPSHPIDVGLLGATGLVGQRFVQLLAEHPWFRLTWVSASERRTGQRYGELPWRLPTPLPRTAASLAVAPPVPDGAPRLVFSALDASVAGEIETAFAAAGHLVVSNARNHRMDPLVPLLIPEVNPDHLALLSEQRRIRKRAGAIVTNPNCSTVVLALVLAALRPFDPELIVVTTLQAASGAGYPGVPSMDLLGNVIPLIPGEEDKLERETRKILGTLRDGRVELAPLTISAQTTRVPVVDGHMLVMSVRLGRPATAEALRETLGGFTGRPQQMRLPSAPEQPLVYRDEPDRPQPRLDGDAGGGMTVSVGRVRPCPIFGWKLVALGHNTVRGAAGAAILNAELLVADGYLE